MENKEASGYKDVYWNYCKKEEMQSEEDADLRTSWKDVPWDLAREEAVKEFVTQVALVSDEVKQKHEDEASAFWDKFYGFNKNKFFKDRHYLHYHFPELQLDKENQSSLKGKKLIEIGCGTGSTLFPLVEQHPDTFFYAIDFSTQAVNLVKSNPCYKTNRVKAFVCDISKGFDSGILDEIEPNSVDVAMMIFVLSALPPNKMKDAIAAVHKILKPGGSVLFRDYGVFDLTQVRFLSKENRKLGDDYYVRADGTSVFYFTLEGLGALFTENNFRTEKLQYDTRELMNRKKLLKMYRVWVTGRFIKE